MYYAFTDIVALLGQRGLNGAGQHITHPLTDSRRLDAPATGLFFALKGPRHNGHDFIPAAYSAGVRCFVVSDAIDKGRFPGSQFIRVPDATQALQQLAGWHRRQYSLPVLGITGSNGKTIVKEWLFQVLHEDYNIVRSPASFNSQVGVPLSLCRIEGVHDLGIFEAGISKVGEMAILGDLIRPSIGLFTNIGTAHAEGFADEAEKIREKAQLFRHAHTLIYCRDHEPVHAVLSGMGKATFTWSRTQEADLVVSGDPTAGGRLLCRYAGVTFDLPMPAADAASVENALHCCAVLLYLGMAPALIQERMQGLTALSMRLELKAGINNCTLINDSYSADLTALGIALDFMGQQHRKARRTVILSDILESGYAPAQLYEAVGELLARHGIDKVLGIGRAIPALGAALPPHCEALFFDTVTDFLAAVPAHFFSNETILLKGARRFGFERISAWLSRQRHRTTLEVNLEALAHNLSAFQRQLPAGVRTMVMVKAAAYGSGSLDVARLLAYMGVHYLAVAYADEGVELRQGGITLPILVLNSEESDFPAMVALGLEPEVYSLAQLRSLLPYIPTGGPPLPIHIKVNTGMNRLGFSAGDWAALLSLLKGEERVRVRSVFSHLAASEDALHDGFTREQAATFIACCALVEQALGYKPMAHLLNSSGIARFPEYAFDMVRLGIGLYGIGGSPLGSSLKHVLTLKSSISQINDLQPGDTVGYGRRGVIVRPSRIATIGIGYADGLSRATGQGRYALLIHGQAAPIVGSVCMDMCMVDVSDIPEACEGDEVLVFGEAHPVEALAAVCQTIPYEILTGISSRVKRVYVQGG